MEGFNKMQPWTAVPKGGLAAAGAKAETALIASTCILWLRLEPVKAQFPTIYIFFKKKEKKRQRKKEKKSDALGKFYASLSPTGQSQDSVHYFKGVIKEFILVYFVSEILINGLLTTM